MTTSGELRRNHQHNTGAGGGREYCWSEDATGTLIEAWGDRYLQLSRGNLRQKDWKDVSDAVNAHHQDGIKPRKTDIQCKNRIDTLKKKYKLERSKPVPSKWPFYSRLDYLIGTNATSPVTFKKVAPLSPHKSSAVTFTVKTNKEKPNPSCNPIVALYSGGSSSKSRLNSPGGSTESSLGGGGGGDERGDDMVLNYGSKKQRMDPNSSDVVVFGEVARAIHKFGEIYERIESSKLQQTMELERQRMEFTKDLEFQRMQMYMDAQLELEKMKRPKYASGTAGKKI